MTTEYKFHYKFNMRDLSKVVQNISLATEGHYRGKPELMIRLWAHECNRVWLDRLINQEDRDKFKDFMTNALEEFGELGKSEIVFEEPLIYTSFISVFEGHKASYLPIKGMDHLK